MRYFAFVLVLVALAFADNDGCTGFSSGAGPYTPGSDDVSLTLVNDWTLVEKALGLEIFEGGGDFFILGVDNNNDYIQAYDAVSCTPLGTLSLDPGNGSCFGVAWNDDIDSDTYYTDDWTNSNLFFTEDFGASWTTVPSPAGNNGRGIAFDGTDYWITNGTGGGLWLFQPGAGQQNIPIPEVTAQPSGVTAYESGGNISVVVSTYGTTGIFFYEWDGATMSFQGSAACPAAGVSSSYGLAYAETNGNIFWSYRDTSSDYHIAEFSFIITALERTTWGAIKNSF